MKFFIFIPLLTILLQNNQSKTNITGSITPDTSSVRHVQDGLVSEWPDPMFQTDKETNIQYAADNDEQDLYIAMKIPDFAVQMKTMRMGMSLFIDMKGKKREGRRIEFPVKNENTGAGGFNGGGASNEQRSDPNQQGGPQKSLNKATMRSRFVMNLIKLKLFGFGSVDPYPPAQELQMPGSVNVNYSWDENDVMYLEYLIPLNLLEKAPSMDNKTISLGWKINGVGMPTSSSASMSPGGGSRSSGGGGFRGGGGSRGNFGGNSGSGQADMEKMMKEQSFWTKYTFH
ncbi:MAG: hypothetical protein KDB99_02880 [Chitinophagaceae bacterium]|nr:hypothetical protein [Chitinophagaceae bacterium]